MEVICNFTKTKVNKKVAFSVLLEGHKKLLYFKSESIYNLWTMEQEADNLIRIKLNNILQVDDYVAYPTSFKAKMKMWKKSYKLLEIYYTIIKFEKELSQHRDKGLNYMSAIIDNNLYVGVDILKKKLNFSSETTNNEVCFKIEKLINENRFLGNRIDVSNL